MEGLVGLSLSLHVRVSSHGIRLAGTVWVLGSWHETDQCRPAPGVLIMQTGQPHKARSALLAHALDKHDSTCDLEVNHNARGRKKS